jgi:hypothetical protein
LLKFLHEWRITGFTRTRTNRTECVSANPDPMKISEDD